MLCCVKRWTVMKKPEIYGFFFSSSLSHNNLNKLHRFWPCHLDVKHHRRRKVSKRHIFEATENRIINRPARQRRSIVCTPGEKLFFLRHNRTCQTVFYFFSALPFRCSPLVQYNCIAKHWKQLNYALIHIVWLNGKKMKIRLNHGCVCVGSFPKKKAPQPGRGPRHKSITTREAQNAFNGKKRGTCGGRTRKQSKNGQRTVSGRLVRCNFYVAADNMHSLDGLSNSWAINIYDEWNKRCCCWCLFAMMSSQCFLTF